MAEIIFKYNGIDTLIQCQIQDKFKNICQKFCIKSQNNINNLIFIYGGEILNLDLEFNQVANQIDKINLKMNILVYDKNTNIKNEKIIKSKDIICPKCGEKCIIDFREYKIVLNNCKNKDESIISINEFEKTQNIDENKIICNICNINNKSKSYKNKFYICGTCNKNICLLCKENHNKDHIIIEYENKNYLCHKHNELFASYCDECKENLCIQCQIEHDNNHKIISYMEILPNINNIKNKIKELRDIIDRFNNNIDDIINIFKNIKMNLEKYYIINNNIMNNYNVRNRNYEIFKNLNNINNNKIMNDLKDIINEKNIINKFNKIYNLNDKIKNNEININEEEKKDEEIKIKNNEIKVNEIETLKFRNEINLIYKTEKKGKQRIFGKKFVENNKNNIELIINEIKSELIEEYELKEGNNNIKLIIKNNLTDLEDMFNGCYSLYNIDELKYLNTSYCTNFSGMFCDCSSLSDIKALEKWDVSKCTNFSYMFGGCSSLSDIKALNKWKDINDKFNINDII